MEGNEDGLDRRGSIMVYRIKEEQGGKDRGKARKKRV